MRYHITKEQAHDACQDAIDAARERYGDVDGLDVEQVLDLDSRYSLGWALWALDRIGAHSLLIRWACDCAERVLQREREEGREPDARSWEAVRVARSWAVGRASLVRLRDARAAVRGAGGTAWYAWSAARDITIAAAWDTSVAVERTWRVQRLREYLRGEAT